MCERERERENNKRRTSRKVIVCNKIKRVKYEKENKFDITLNFTDIQIKVFARVEKKIQRKEAKLDDMRQILSNEQQISVKFEQKCLFYFHCNIQHILKHRIGSWIII